MNTTLKKVADKLYNAKPRNNEAVAIYGYIVGALFSLNQAKNNIIQLSSDAYDEAESRKVIKAIAEKVKRNKNSVSRKWLSEYYFNSALHRMSAIACRLSKYVGKRQEYTKKVVDEVDRMKHDVESITNGRKVMFDDAINCLELLSDTFISVCSKKPAQHALAGDTPTGREKSRVQGVPSLRRRRKAV
jgi:hypothetical protein